MIKWIFLLQCTIASSYFIYGQESIHTLYFANPSPQHIESSINFPKDIQGCYYKNNDSLIQICVTKDSIYTSFSIVFSIPSNEIKVGKYEIIDSLVYGIKKGIGLLYKEINDTVFAFLKQTDLFFKFNEKSILKIDSNRYYLNELINEKYYSILEISKNENQFEVREYDPQIKDFPIEDLQTVEKNFQNQKIYLANPNKKNWNSFIENNGFNDQTLYHK